jgi:hypothetical protein
MKQIAFAAALLAIAAAAPAAPALTKILVNPPSTDDGQEFVEIVANPSENLSTYTLLVIDGDGTNAGTIDVARPLTVAGTNGMLLLRDAAAVISPGPASGTNVVVADFSPDLENGSSTFLVVTGFSSTAGTDLDTNDDGTLESTPWTSVASAVGFIENDGASNYSYAVALGGSVLGPLSPTNPGAFFYGAGAWQASTVTGDAATGYTISATVVTNPIFGGMQLNPGTPGVSSVEEWINY